MTQFILLIIAIPMAGILLLFNIRRIIFTLTILLDDKKEQSSSSGQIHLPEVLILVPCRDEAGMIPELCQSLSEFDYPRESYQVLLIDDGSTDGTGLLMEQQAASRPGWQVLRCPGNLGKANTLNTALAQFPFGEIIYIFDADHRPDAQVLRRAVRYFYGPKVVAVTGFTKVVNPVASPSAFYSTVESYINQLVTIRAKDRLGLAPALLGSNCAYRRGPLIACGGFRSGAFSEDSDLTVTFYKAGYRVRFAEDAISYQQVPQSVDGYLKQHIRWGRGLNDVAKIHSLEILRSPSLSLRLRLELLFFMSGYLDRLALIGAGILTIASYLSNGPFHFFLAILMFALLTPFAQIIGLFIRERMNIAMWARLPLVPIFFALDILAAMRAIVDTLLNRSRVWSKTERGNSLA
jgi:1,2-diacylglycerol 3-beta-glucosyltransferase